MAFNNLTNNYIILVRLLVTLGSLITIGFGLWHFFVPQLWQWYSYIDPSATELVLAVRAINLLFSLSLVLFGSANLLVLYRKPPEKFSLLVLLAASTLLWGFRTALQILHPQMTFKPALKIILLLVFVVVFLSFAVALILEIINNTSLKIKLSRRANKAARILILVLFS